MTDHENGFHEKMLYICREANKQGYNPTILASMINKYGGVEAAKRLVVQNEPTEGFLRLYMMNRLDLTAERFVIDKEFCDLFTEREINISKERLRSYNYKVD